MTKGVRIAIALALAIASAGVAYAALPALALAAQILVPIVVRSVGRAVTVNVGIAANDAAWSATLGAWVTNSTRIGSLLWNMSEQLSAELQLVSNEPMTIGPTGEGYRWYVAPLPSGYNQEWAMSTGHRLYSVHPTKAAAASAAIAALNAKYGATCVNYQNGGFFAGPTVGMFPDSLSDEMAIDCFASGWSSHIFHSLIVQRNPSQLEQRDGIGRVTRTDFGMGRDESDPDWWWSISPSSDYYSKGNVRLVALGSDEENEAMVDIAVSPSGLFARAADPAGSATTVRELEADVANVPRTFTQYQTQVIPADLPAVQAPSSGSNPGTGSGTGTTNVTVQFPTDYARQNEAMNAANHLGDRLLNGSDMADPTLPDGEAFNSAFFAETFNNLLGWSLPGHGSQCPTASFQWNGTTYTFSEHCALVNDYWGVISSVMLAIWWILALFIVLGA